MEGVLDAGIPLDYVAFQMSPSHNRYEAFAGGGGKREKVASGLLDQLLLHLPGAKAFRPDGSNDNFLLQLPENRRGSLWFTKSTLIRFLHIFGEPESLKIVGGIEDEMSQLEEARKFHLSLYAHEQQDHSQIGVTDRSYSKDIVATPKLEVQTGSSDATKNELLRAMDLRLTALREELAASFNRAIGATCSVKEVADLDAFAQHFGAENLRRLLSKYLSLCVKNQDGNLVNGRLTLHGLGNNNRIEPESVTEVGLSVNEVKPSRNGVSPAKIAQAERRSSTESEESSNSSDEDRSPVERSRPLIRSASPRRSASPMRRIQIGRSGSRRATALTIKSLSYIPAREKVSSNRDAAANSSGDEESEQPPKKSENTIRRMSVQDAINLFESKQRDQKTDIQKWRSSIEAPVATNRSVLRRWSAGVGEASAHCPQENSECGSLGQSNNSTVEPAQSTSVEVKQESDFLAGSSDPVKPAVADESSAEEEASTVVDNSANLVVAKDEEMNDRTAASAEWNRQKEAELNQMLMKMLESKPARYRNTTGSTGKQELSGEQRGGFYDHYKEKRDAKIRGENAGKRAEKEARFKAMQQTLDQRKAEMGSKSKKAGVTGKQVSPSQSQNIRRNSTSVLPKKEPLKPTPSRKALPKASPLPATRSSWPSTPSPRSIGPPSAKISSGTSSSGTTPNRRKPQPQPTPSPSRRSPKLDRSEQRQKGMVGSQTEKKKILKSQQEKQQQVVAKSNKTTKTKMTAASMDDSVTVPAKPSFYSKVTKKSSVVPLESKPFLRKGTGIGPGVGPVVAKTKTSQSDESSKSSGNLTLGLQENDVISGTVEMTNQLPVEEVAQPENDDADLEVLENDNQKFENTENSEQFSGPPNDGFTKTAEISEEIQAEEDSGISPIAWVESNHQELPISCDSGPSQIAIPANVAPVAISSPRVRHSLSQMLQADSGEPDIIEWGNAENPPAMIYQKDSPKGLKRLLKFARKSKGEANVTGWASPSVFSEGEEDADEPKAASKRSADALMRKSALQAKGFGQQKTMFSESSDGGNSSKGSISYTATHELLSGQSNVSNFSTQVSHKLREGQTSAGAVSTKASRSFFSLPTFRSSKSSETKLR
ncbi:hypothetical protein AAC387_Pa06g1376 [Persea americana]